MNVRRRFLLWGTVAAVMVLPACSDDGATAPVTTVAPTTTLPATTAEPTTTAAPTTLPPATLQIGRAHV